MKEFYERYRWTILLVLLGIILTVLIFTINFWRTLLLCVIVGVCFLIGSLLDKGGKDAVKSFFDKILPKG
ncbi:MAG: DUF2273 domain-containing protein [Eubacteriales bacterium]|nr:DUF2273 domain-containing protein [Eubacteriales bacterium]